MGRGEGSSPRVRGKRKIVIPDNTFFRLIPACAGKTQRRPSFCRPGRAHPRAGGENALGGQYVFGDMGSSPRWRGKPRTLTVDLLSKRLIPALAGKTNAVSGLLSGIRAHPRAGGENVTARSISVTFQGSSPRWRGKRPVRLTAPPPLVAHPRAGGENSPDARGANPRAGSSPRWRGKRVGRKAEALSLRLIPALAGKTRSVRVARSIEAAHPRAGGENLTLKRYSSMDTGSSPRWRGKLRLGWGMLGCMRLIPALAGKTLGLGERKTFPRAHPRAGGENSVLVSLARFLRGSSPRWRGKPPNHPINTLSSRLIPALAGKTKSSRSRSTAAPAHPRAGGENCLSQGGQLRSVGSSPRWRGKPARSFVLLEKSRLIPALAGKTSKSESFEISSTAHPRAGGENLFRAREIAGGAGSSPRWRGKRATLAARVETPRLIPALAGKTLQARAGHQPRPAHPRAGGENNASSTLPASNGGSSPRWRGKLCFAVIKASQTRLIPALAGKTSIER